MNRKARVWLWILAGFVCVALIAGVAIWRVFSVRVTVYNAAATRVENVRVSLADEEIWSGALGMGEKHTVRDFPDGEGAVEVSFAANGRTYRQQFGYVTPWLAGDYYIVVLPTFEMRAVPR